MVVGIEERYAIKFKKKIDILIKIECRICNM